MSTTKRASRTTAAIAALAAVSVLSLTACASDGAGGADADGVTTLTMTAWGGDIDKATYQERIDLFEASQDKITVDLQLIPGDQYEQKVQTMIASGDGPDILEVAEGVNIYSSKNQIIPLDDLVASSGLDLEERFGPVGELYSYNDSVYAIPDRSGAMIVYYNKDMFDAAGVAYPTAAWTTQDAQSAMEKLTVPDAGQWGYAGANWWAQWWSFAYQLGGQVIDEDGQPAANSPEVVEALQWANDLPYKYHVVPTAAEYADMGADMGGDQAFAAQKVAMNTTGFWGISGLLEADFNWDIAPLWQGDEQAVSAFGSGLAISRDSEKSEAAFEAIDFLTSAEGQVSIINSAQDVPANLEVQQSDAFLKPVWATREVDMAAFGESADFVFTAPLIPQWNEMQAAFDDNLGTFWNQGGDAQAQLDIIQKKLESVIEPTS